MDSNGGARSRGTDNTKKRVRLLIDEGDSKSVELGQPENINRKQRDAHSRQTLERNSLHEESIIIIDENSSPKKGGAAIGKNR